MIQSTINSSGKLEKPIVTEKPKPADDPKKEDSKKEDYKKDEPIEIYTDGACSANGTDKAAAGIGVFYGDKDERNVAEKFPFEHPTNQRAEIYACIRAIEAIKDKKKYRIVSDSDYTIKSVTVWSKKWLRNGWKSGNKKPVKNKELLMRLLNACKGKNVEWKHVRGHAGNKGNEAADRLAVAGALGMDKSKCF